MTLSCARGAQMTNMTIVTESQYSESAKATSTANANVTIRALTYAEIAWLTIHKMCERWYAMKKIEDQIREQEAQAFHEFQQAKKVSKMRVSEQRRRDEIEFGEDDELSA